MLVLLILLFDKDVTVYTLTVPYDTESVILSGSLEDITSTVDGLIEYKLTDDKTTANITVVAEDGTIKVYTVYIIKEQNLKMLLHLSHIIIHQIII